VKKEMAAESRRGYEKVHGKRERTSHANLDGHGRKTMLSTAYFRRFSVDLISSLGRDVFDPTKNQMNEITRELTFPQDNGKRHGMGLTALTAEDKGKARRGYGQNIKAHNPKQ